MRTVAGIVLAAGAGRRFGSPKAEIVLDGERLVQRAVRVLAEGGCEPVVAVVRAGTVVEGAIAVVNDAPERGMGSSLRLGLTAALATPADRAVITLVDVPGVTAQAVRALAGCPARIAAANYAGRRGHPVAIDRSLWEELAETLHGDVGARAFLATHPELVADVPLAGTAVDIDTPADLARWRDT